MTHSAHPFALLDAARTAIRSVRIYGGDDVLAITEDLDAAENSLLKAGAKLLKVRAQRGDPARVAAERL